MDTPNTETPVTANGQKLLQALDALQQMAATPQTEPAETKPAAEAVSDTRTVEVPKLTIKITKLGSDEVTTVSLSPNRYNVLMWLLMWKQQCEPDQHDRFVFEFSNMATPDKAAPALTLEAAINEYDTKTLGVGDVQQVLADCVQFLMLNSALGAIAISATVVHPAQGPVTLQLLGGNTLIDNAELIKHCTKATVNGCSVLAQRYAEEQKAAKKGELILPDKTIVTPR